VAKRKSLEQRFREIEEEIEEVKKRLPAHSVKPPLMSELLALEDERDALKEKLAQLPH